MIFRYIHTDKLCIYIYIRVRARVYISTLSTHGLTRLSCQSGRPRISVCERITSIHNPLLWLSRGGVTSILQGVLYVRVTKYKHVLCFNQLWGNTYYIWCTYIPISAASVLVPCLVVWFASFWQPSIKHHYNHHYEHPSTLLATINQQSWSQRLIQCTFPYWLSPWMNQSLTIINHPSNHPSTIITTVYQH